MKEALKNLIVVAVIIIGCFFFFFFRHPIMRWLLVDTTVEIYEQTTNRFEQNDEVPSYSGLITDTIITLSNIKGEQHDTTIHKQQIDLKQNRIKNSGKPTYSDLGAFSDSAGFLGALFSLMAFLAVVFTIFYQWTKDRKDKKYAARMQFENEFFSMTAMLENIVSHLKFSDQRNLELSEVTSKLLNLYHANQGGNSAGLKKTERAIIVEGREVFKYLYTDRDNFSLLEIVNNNQILSETSEAQDMCFDGTLDHYFRYLYRILRHIEKSELLEKLDYPDKEREYYAHLLRAQLSSYELLMLFYNGLLGENPDTIKVLIEKYAMFNNLRAWELGNYQRDYYQAIMDEEIIEDPVKYNKRATYSVRAFWDEKKLMEIRERVNKENKELSWYEILWSKLMDSYNNRNKKPDNTLEFEDDDYEQLDEIFQPSKSQQGKEDKDQKASTREMSRNDQHKNKTLKEKRKRKRKKK